jgi:hypothetical protein
MRIPKLLEHMSSQVARSTNLPSKSEVVEQKEALGYN